MVDNFQKALWLICLIIAGCTRSSGGLQTVPAAGIVTYNGAAVPSAVVVFQPAHDEGSTKAAQTQTGEDGAFTLQTYLGGSKVQDGVMPGEYLVSIRKVEPSANVTGPPRELLPRKYGNAKSSGLKAAVKAGGKNEFDFKLTD